MDFGNYKEKLASRKPVPGINIYEQEIANEVTAYLNDKKEFGLWVRVAKRIGAGELKAKLGYMKERGITNPRYLLKICSK